jgi:hypothetical protein
MATYKVPQDVEADDKLIGPFSFRQFVYLIIVALAIALAWGLAQLFIGLVIVPLPIVLLFGALALPLRKDQPMETYLAAMVSFFLKPHKRLWDPDGLDSLIEITAPRMVEVQRTKDISEGEAERRFGYLAEIVDTQGWAVRGSGVQAPNSAMTSDAYFAAQQVQDVMDTDNTTAQVFMQKLDQSDTRRHQDAVNMMRQPTAPVVETPPPVTPGTFSYFSAPPIEATVPNMAAPTGEPLEYNPYPEDMRQTVIKPIDDLQRPVTTSPAIPTMQQPAIPRPTTSKKPVAAGIINLANNPDLSIETIAREANRIQSKQDLGEEVVISLR